MLSEQDFRLEADRALEQAQQALLPLADQEGFEVELQNGVLQIVFETPTVGKFVVSPNAPVQTSVGVGVVSELQAVVGRRHAGFQAGW
jgi:frataxin-like iron-binding protein CyaY